MKSSMNGKSVIQQVLSAVCLGSSAAFVLVAVAVLFLQMNGCRGCSETNGCAGGCPPPDIESRCIGMGTCEPLPGSSSDCECVRFRFGNNVSCGCRVRAL